VCGERVRPACAAGVCGGRVRTTVTDTRVCDLQVASATKLCRRWSIS
jgi:hypothetical protein